MRIRCGAAAAPEDEEEVNDGGGTKKSNQLKRGGAEGHAEMEDFSDISEHEDASPKDEEDRRPDQTRPTTTSVIYVTTIH